MSSTTFDYDQDRIEDRLPFGVVQPIVAGRWGFRVGVKRLENETYFDANRRIAAGVGGIFGHECFSNGFRCRWDDVLGTIILSGPNKKAIARILEDIWPLTLKTLIPGPVAMRAIR